MKKLKSGSIIISEKKERCYFCKKDIIIGSFCVLVNISRKEPFAHLSCLKNSFMGWDDRISGIKWIGRFLEEIKKDKYVSQIIIDNLR